MVYPKQFKNGEKDKMYHTLVKLETDFIFNKVCKRVYNEIPGIQLLTCHDEIYFEERFYEQVLKIWAEELEKVYEKISVNHTTEFDFDDTEHLQVTIIKIKLCYMVYWNFFVNLFQLFCPYF